MNRVTTLALAALLAATGELAAATGAAAPSTVPAPDSVLLQFTSQRCPHCRSMQPIVEELSRQGVRVQAVDVEAQLDVAKQFSVPGVPAFVAVSGGRETGRIVGATSYEKLAELVGAGASGQGPAASGQGPAANGQEPPTNRLPGSAASSPSPDPRGASPDAARAATVRLKVEDATGYGFGTGTVIDTHDSEALVMTCGHLFRESKGQGKITADLFSAGTAQTVDGQLIGYDLDRDIALISLRAGPAIRPAMVAPPGYAVRPGDRAFSIGCDKGTDPTIRQTHITAVNKYKGKPNFTAAGQPVDGRSGGGLFSAEGYLIGICNAADPADDEGIYAGLASIHWQLDQIGQSEIYQRASRLAAAGQADNSAAVASTTSTTPSSLAVPPLPPQMPAASLSAASAPAGTSPAMQPAAASLPAAARLPSELAPIVAAGEDTEIVFIVRSKRDPAQRSEVFVVDQAPPDLVARITHAARTSGEQRAALARAAAANRTGAPAAVPATSAVVRGQMADY
jgi:S1-C subfamily serine protease